jgi:nickel/cobalt exporter
MKQLLLLFVFSSILAGPAMSLATPSAASDTPMEVRASRPSEWRLLYQKALHRLVRWQKTLRAELTRLMRGLRDNPLGAPLWSFLAMAFVYGIVHALGPGHGKAIAGSYFLHRTGTLKQGLLLGLLFAFTHVFSAVLVLLIGHFLLQTAAGSLLDSADRRLQKISAILLITIGLLLTARSLWNCRPHQERTRPQNQQADFKSLCSVAAAAGLVPCPGAALILLFALSQHLLVPGLLSMLALALGMAVTVASFALVTMATRGVLLRVLSASRSAIIVGRILGIAGGLAIATLGAVLLSSLA